MAGQRKKMGRDFQDKNVAQTALVRNSPHFLKSAQTVNCFANPSFEQERPNNCALEISELHYKLRETSLHSDVDHLIEERTLSRI